MLIDETTDIIIEYYWKR